ncbi:uncharacterized protein LOC142587081 [Dermacentor variabilis]|uniref:uncharacterized protein LOC142587081 n=1 Tax=Dermacentor variabilis TaxID=34621 RepID=UPI003F5B741C
MNAKYAAAGFLLLGFIASTIAADPPCPLVNCVAGSRVGCFITRQRCECSCVQGIDPCRYVTQRYSRKCAPNQVLKCKTDVQACKCRCARR